MDFSTAAHRAGMFGVMAKFTLIWLGMAFVLGISFSVYMLTGGPPSQEELAARESMLDANPIHLATFAVAAITLLGGFLYSMGICYLYLRRLIVELSK